LGQQGCGNIKILRSGARALRENCHTYTERVDSCISGDQFTDRSRVALAGSHWASAPRFSETKMSGLRIIPISHPGGGISFTIAQTDAEEVGLRARAVREGLLAGGAMPSQPNPAIWSLLDSLKKR
jgi:hypothetical protein